jgi:hypothetical protein
MRLQLLPRLALGLTVLVGLAPAARAQPSSPTSPLLASQSPAPPLALVMPPPTPAFVPGATPDLPELPNPAADLEQRAHRKKLSGGTLMGLGSLVAASGLAVLLDGALEGSRPGLCAGRCSGGDLVVAGAVGLGVGTAAVATGIPIWLSGVGDARQALRLRDPGIHF